MAVNVIMPKAGMSMEEGKVVSWLKKEGDAVETGEPLLMIETDKVNMEVEAPASGVLLKILKADGEVVPVTKTIGYIGKPGEKIEVEEVEIEESGKQENEKVPVEESVAAIKTAALSGEAGKIPATPLAKTLAAKNDIDIKSVAPTGSHGEIKARDVEAKAKVLATPLARRIAEDMRVDLGKVQGSGFMGKVRKEDIPAAASEERKPLKSMRRIIGERMLKSHLEIPPVTLNMKADVTELVDIRERMNKGSGFKVSFNDFILKAAATALSEMPSINASIEGDEILYKKDINIGMAVALDDGLMVPVIKNADRLSLKKISQKAKELSAKAREGKLLLDELSGGTFTVSNLGMYDVLSFTPIINQPEAAILGVCSIEGELRMVGDKVLERKFMGLSLTFDHRILDGAKGAVFLRRIKALLENPLDLLSQ